MAEWLRNDYKQENELVDLFYSITKFDYHSFSAIVKRRIGIGGVQIAAKTNRGTMLFKSKRQLKRY